MPDIELSAHTKEMLVERNIPEEWISRAIEAPDEKIIGSDNNIHFIKVIAEYDNRFLRVIVNPNIQPNRVVTVF